MISRYASWTTPRAMPIGSLLEAFPGAVVAREPGDALESLGDPLLAVGSLRLVGAMLKLAASLPSVPRG